MKLLSSGWTFPMKWIFPNVALGIVFILFLTDHPFDQIQHDPGLWITLGIMLAIWFLACRVQVWNLADEVQDCGSYLMVRRGSVRARVELSDISYVSTRQYTNPRRVTLRLRTPGAFGDRIVFLLKSSFRLNPFVGNSAAEDLIQRIDRIRVQARP